MAISLTDSRDSQEPTTPTRIGAGSFATVFDSPGRPIAIKVAHAPDQAAQVEWEYTSLQVLHTTTQNDPNALFIVPRPLAYYDPQTQKLLFPPISGSPSGHATTTDRRRRVPNPRPFNPEFFSDIPPRPCYVMTRAAPLPPRIARRVRAHFYPTRAVGSAPLPLPLICRLYFGKELRPSAFVNPVNFPLDAARYDLLRDGDEDTPPKDEVVAGMGEMLAVIHWKAGYDARDVEFVMAGARDSAGVRLYVIDFNQLRVFDRVEGDLSELVDAFFVNDPYYPRPVPGDPLYDSFQRGYLSACPAEHRERAALFLQAIEAHHAENRLTTTRQAK